MPKCWWSLPHTLERLGSLVCLAAIAGGILVVELQFRQHVLARFVRFDRWPVPPWQELPERMRDAVHTAAHQLAVWPDPQVTFVAVGIVLTVLWLKL